MIIEITLPVWFTDFIQSIQWRFEGKCPKHGIDYEEHGYYNDKRCIDCHNENYNNFLK